MNLTRLFPFAAVTAVSTLLAPVQLTAEEPAKWTFENSLYMLAAGMSGEVGVKGVVTDLNVGFDDVMENLEFGAMGTVKVGYGRWALTTDVIFMALGASKGPFSGDVDQWIVEPALSYRVCRYFEPLVGFRYNNLAAEIRGPLGVTRSGTQDWFEPFVGALVTVPFTEKWSFKIRGDAGGFGAGAELTWQAFPHLNWEISRRFSAQAGYRWVSTDYHDGSGTDSFVYDVLSQGPQVGLTLKF